jgi:hypothetical protein
MVRHNFIGLAGIDSSIVQGSVVVVAYSWSQNGSAIEHRHLGLVNVRHATRAGLSRPPSALVRQECSGTRHGPSRPRCGLCAIPAAAATFACERDPNNLWSHRALHQAPSSWYVAVTVTRGKCVTVLVLRAATGNCPLRVRRWCPRAGLRRSLPCKAPRPGLPPPPLHRWHPSRCL